MAAVDLREALSIEALQRASEAILRARRIDCFGVGGSAVAALDAYQKFVRLGVPTQFTLDTHMQTTSAATLRAGDVAPWSSRIPGRSGTRSGPRPWRASEAPR
jgi:DNA-binding MurR/RpiR family transcriptional regulator